MIRVQTEDFDVGAEMQLFRQTCAGRAGAITTFVGLMRDYHHEQSVSRMELEYYPGMTEKAFKQLEAEALKRWELQQILIIHRVGVLKPADQIVLVMVASAHRKAAFEACEYLIDQLKTRVPLWKKETREDGAHWVDARGADQVQADNWKSR